MNNPENAAQVCLSHTHTHTPFETTYDLLGNDRNCLHTHGAPRGLPRLAWHATSQSCLLQATAAPAGCWTKCWAIFYSLAGLSASYGLPYILKQFARPCECNISTQTLSHCVWPWVPFCMCCHERPVLRSCGASFCLWRSLRSFACMLFACHSTNH